jgi:hypothetical protein
VFRLFPTLTVFAGILTAGLIPGLWAGRWIPAVSLDEAVARLPNIPYVVGEWTGRDLPVKAAERTAANASGFLRRRYVNARTGGSVALLVLCGRPGPIAVHTPDVCFRGSGFDEIGKSFRHDIPGSTGSRLWVRQFQKAQPSPVTLRVFYGWSANGTWEASDSPRLAFARSPVLYKLYVIRDLAVPDEPLAEDPAGELLRALATPLRAILFPSA